MTTLRLLERITVLGAPLVSHIRGHLWMGGVIDGVQLPADFRYVVSLHPWDKYRIGRNAERREFPLHDANEVPPVAQLLEIAALINRNVALGPTLVHCQAGLNRSGLVTALAMVRTGMPARAAVDLLRERRTPDVLCNTTFETWLLTESEAL